MGEGEGKKEERWRERMRCVYVHVCMHIIMSGSGGCVVYRHVHLRASNNAKYWHVQLGTMQSISKILLQQVNN